jgi:anti-sigma B factor antagonist
MRDRELVYTINEGSREGSVIVRLDGPLTLGNIFGFQEELRAIHPPLTVFDLTASEYMDSAGLGVLVNFYVSAEKNGRKMALAGVSDRILALLDLTHLRSLLRVFPTLDEALTNC